MIKLVVFDFDGTLADTKSLLLELLVKNLPEYKLDAGFLRDFGNRPFQETLVQIGVEQKVLSTIAKRTKIDIAASAKRAVLVPGIEKLEEIGKPKVILSNSVGEFISKALKINGINIFEKVIASEQFNHKDEAFKKLMKEYGAKGKEVVYVGDRPVDCELARRMKCICVLISQKASWSPLEDLLEAKPDYLISNISDLREIIDSLDSV